MLLWSSSTGPEPVVQFAIASCRRVFAQPRIGQSEQLVTKSLAGW